MINKLLIAIDPGKTGAIAMHYKNNTIVQDMAENPVSISLQIDNMMTVLGYNSTDGILAILENVHSMPGQNCVAIFTFGELFGVIKGILAAKGIPCALINPKDWQKKLGGLPSSQKINKNLTAKEKNKLKYDNKKQLKTAIRDRMQALHPHLRITLLNADALAILTVAINSDK